MLQYKAIRWIAVMSLTVFPHAMMWAADEIRPEADPLHVAKDENLLATGYYCAWTLYTMTGTAPNITYVYVGRQEKAGPSCPSTPIKYLLSMNQITPLPETCGTCSRTFKLDTKPDFLLEGGTKLKGKHPKGVAFHGVMKTNKLDDVYIGTVKVDADRQKAAASTSVELEEVVKIKLLKNAGTKTALLAHGLFDVSKLFAGTVPDDYPPPYKYSVAFGLETEAQDATRTLDALTEPDEDGSVLVNWDLSVNGGKKLTITVPVFLADK